MSTELARFENHKTIPLALVISLTCFIPIVAYITLQATTSMFKYVYWSRNLTTASLFS